MNEGVHIFRYTSSAIAKSQLTSYIYWVEASKLIDCEGIDIRLIMRTNRSVTSRRQVRGRLSLYYE